MKKTMLVAVDSFLPQITGVAIVSMEFIKRLSKHYNLIVFAPSHGFLNVEQVDAEFYFSPLIPFLNVHGFQACFPPLLMMRQAMKKVDIVFTHTFGPVGGLAIYLSAKFHIPCFAYCLSIDWELYPHALGLSGYMHRIVPAGDLIVINKYCHILIH